MRLLRRVSGDIIGVEGPEGGAARRLIRLIWRTEVRRREEAGRLWKTWRGPRVPVNVEDERTEKEARDRSGWKGAG